MREYRGFEPDDWSFLCRPEGDSSIWAIIIVVGIDKVAVGVCAPSLPCQIPIDFSVWPELIGFTVVFASGNALRLVNVG